MIERTAHIKLLEDLREYPAVAITGARQTGKTTLAKQMVDKLQLPVYYLDLEFPDDIAKLQNPVLFFKEHENDCLILDEIHRMPDLFPVMRSLIDQNRRPARFIILGSASPALLRDSSESLAGRISYTHLTPLNVIETQQNADWQMQLVRGGFPPSLLATSDKSSFRWRSNFIQTYLERELPNLGLDSDVRILRKLLIMIAQSQAQLLNTQGLSNSLGVTRPTVARYIDFMEKAYLLTRLEPFYTNLGKRLVKSPKLYLSDTGLFHALLGVQHYEKLIEHPLIGASWEAFVIQQTQSLLPDDLDMWFFRTHEGAEADLVITRNDEPISCAEIKWTNAPKVSKGFRNVIGYLKTNRNFIITPDAETYPVAENIRVTSLVGWLNGLTAL